MRLPSLGWPLGGKKSAASPAQQRALKRRELLELRPLRNPELEWNEQDGCVVLHIERTSTWKTRLIELFVPVPAARTIVLDAIGTDVWKMLDGQSTMGEIVDSLAKKYQLSAREAEISLQQFFKELGRRGYVGFVTAVPPPSDEAGKEKSSAQKSAGEDA